MTFIDGFFCAVFLLLAWLAGGVFGLRYGFEVAVDSTKRKGFFLAYGKKWKAVEDKD